jgi:hypothetical protein
MQVVEENNPSRKCEDAKDGTGNETRARHLRGCVETLAEENAKESAGNGTQQDNVFDLLQRHSQWKHHCKTESGLDHILG